MPLEATMIVIDNSEYMRNGDYAPTRFGAQSEAATTLFQAKVDSNAENTVGIMTMAGKGPEVLVTHTKHVGQIHAALHASSSRIGGVASIPTAIAIAQLALKHRQNKNLRQRVVVFVGSPLEGPNADEHALVRLAKKLKKNNVAVDVVAFGDGIEQSSDGGTSILRAFVEAASSNDNSHYIAVPPGPHFLSDILATSPILAGDSLIPELAGDAGAAGAGAGGSGAGAGGAAPFDFGIDPSLDPELAMALRMSLEEEQARQAAAAAQSSSASTSAPEPAAAAAAATAAAAPASSAAPAPPTAQPAHASEDEEDALLQQALALSEGRDVEMADGGAAPAGSAAAPDEDDEMSEEEAIARAIEMSMRGEEEGEKK